jgi:hypothetical protein
MHADTLERSVSDATPRSTKELELPGVWSLSHMTQLSNPPVQFHNTTNRLPCVFFNMAILMRTCVLTLLLNVPLLLAGKSASPEHKLVSIQAEPAQVVLDGKFASQQVLINGTYSDGSVHDVTSQASFKSSAPAVAPVTPKGVVTAASDGKAAVTISVKGAKKKISLPVTVKHSREVAASYSNDIRPLFTKLGCNATACHGTRAGKGGLKLAMFGGDPETDYDALTRAAGGRRINRVDPADSLVLLKAENAITHGGGKAIQPDSAEHETLLTWLKDGALFTVPKEATLTGIRVAPEQRNLAKGESQPLLVTALYSDGTYRDVTRAATFQAADPKTISVDKSVARAQEYGEASIAVTYLGQAAVCLLHAPQPLPVEFPPFQGKPQAGNHIDELVYAKLKSLGIPPSELATDQDFLRRVYLDEIGVLPTAKEAREFLADRSPDKRAKLIDRLFKRDEYADFWALKWSDLLRIKSEYPVKVWPKAVAIYYKWLHDSLAQNKPYNRLVTELLTANGSDFRNPAVNYYRAMQDRDPRTIGETTALVFMGARVSCARCHSHPTESWGIKDDLALAAFFSRIRYKSTLEWKEEIVYADVRATMRDPRSRAIIAPKFLTGPVPEVAKEEDPRYRFAQWLTSPGNPWFARNVVNRIWYWLMGRGIVHEPDDMRSTNPPENPELLDYLARELVTHNFDLQHIYRLILNSRTYQTTSSPNQWNAWDSHHFSHYPIHRLTAEQMLDAISLTTETYEKFWSIIPEPYSNWPAGTRAEQISDGNTTCSFLDLFGRPGRDTPFESERSSEASLRQELYLLNSEQLAGKLSSSPSINRLLKANVKDPELVDEIYLMTLSRFPSADEKQKLVAYLTKNSTARPTAVQDVVWAVFNTKEFLFNH